MKIDTKLLETRLFINNEFVPSVSGKTFPTINPATEEVICQVYEADADDVNKAVRVICDFVIDIMRTALLSFHDTSKSLTFFLSSSTDTKKKSGCRRPGGL